MTHARRPTLLGTVFAVICLGALFPTGSDALDRPIVDAKRSETCTFVERETLENLPTSSKQFAALALLVPGQAVLETRLDSKRRPTGAILQFGDQRWDFNKTQLNRGDCSYSAVIKNGSLWNGYSADIKLNRHTQPDDRAYVRAYNLKLNGGAIRGEQLWFFKPYGTSVTEQPRPEEMPVIPVPPTTPTEPSGYLGPYDIRVPNGTTFDLRMSVRPHANHAGHSFFDGSFEDYLCRKAEGYSQIRISDAMRDSFNFQRTPPPREGLIWEDGRCSARSDRSVDCKLKGTYYKTPVLSSWTARAVHGSPNIQGEGSLEINSDVLKYDLSGSWKQ